MIYNYVSLKNYLEIFIFIIYFEAINYMLYAELDMFKFIHNFVTYNTVHIDYIVITVLSL